MFGENVVVLDECSFETVTDVHADANVVLNFYAPWCTVCTENHPVYEELATRVSQVPYRILLHLILSSLITIVLDRLELYRTLLLCILLYHAVSYRTVQVYNRTLLCCIASLLIDIVPSRSFDIRVAASSRKYFTQVLILIQLNDDILIDRLAAEKPYSLLLTDRGYRSQP